MRLVGCVPWQSNNRDPFCSCSLQQAQTLVASMAIKYQKTVDEQVHSWGGKRPWTMPGLRILPSRPFLGTSTLYHWVRHPRPRPLGVLPFTTIMGGIVSPAALQVTRTETDSRLLEVRALTNLAPFLASTLDWRMLKLKSALVGIPDLSWLV